MHRPAGVSVALVLAVLLSGCATDAGGDGTPTAVDVTADSTADNDPAQGRADAWLDAAVLPPEAVASPTMPITSVSFDNVYYGWPCTPVAEITAYWTIADASVVETTNWLISHPTADLIVTTRPVSEADGADLDMTSVANVPAVDAQEGVLYTVAEMAGGVAVRAEIAARTETSTCPSLPPGGQMGGVGEG